MSRAFTKERDDVPEPSVESHVAGVPVRLTAAGRSKLERELAASESSAERQRLTHLLADAVVTAPPEDRSVVAFGATVEIAADSLGRRHFTVVGPDEADVAGGRISASSPLGVALIGARAGDVVTWHRPIGDLPLRIVAIAYDAPAEPPRSAES